MIKEIIHWFQKQHFLKTLTMLVGGSAAAQVLNFLFQPLISRLYKPEEFGIYALFSSSVALLCIIVTLSYEQSIVASTNEDEAQRLMFGTLYLSTTLSVLIMIFIGVFGHFLAKLLGSDDGAWLYFIPLNTLATCFYTVVSSYNYRIKKYRDLASSSVLRVVALCLFQIGLYYSSSGYLGLIIGNTFGLFFGTFSLIKNILNSQIDMQNARADLVIKTLKNNRAFPLFQLPASFVNHFTSAAITYVIMALYSPAALGIYSLTLRVLSLPINVVSTSARQLCISYVAGNAAGPVSIKRFYERLTIGMLSTMVIPFVFLFLFGNHVFSFVFGAQWGGAGNYIRAMCIVYIIRFVAYPLSGVAIVLKRQRELMFFQIALGATVFVSAFFAKVFSLSVEMYLFIQSTIMSIIYFLMWLFCYDIITKETSQVSQPMHRTV